MHYIARADIARVCGPRAFVIGPTWLVLLLWAAAACTHAAGAQQPTAAPPVDAAPNETSPPKAKPGDAAAKSAAQKDAAQQKDSAQKDAAREKTATAAAGAKPRVIALTVSPAADPRAPLRLRLLPEYLDRKGGNRADGYHRALLMAEQTPKEAIKKVYAEFYDKPDWNRDEHLLPPGMKPSHARSLLDEVGILGPLYKELEGAAWRDRCHWGVRLRELTGTDPIAVLLPEVQGVRDLARRLSLRFRLELAEGRVEAARKTQQIMWQLSRDVTETPPLVNGLVGIAIADMAASDLRQSIQQPSAPNLYWAVTALPRPWIDLREAMEQEQAFPLQLAPVLRDVDRPRSADEWRNILRDMLKGMREFDGSAPQGAGWQNEAAAAGLMLAFYPTAKRKLIEAGRDRKEVEAMAAAQVVLVYCAARYHELWGEAFKFAYLPFPEAFEHGRRAEAALAKLAKEASDPMVILAKMLLPAINGVVAAQARAERTLDELRVIEALRMFAAANGRWPKSLDEITQVPVPMNPAMGKPFAYRLEGELAIFEGYGPGRDGPQVAVRYELKLRPGAK